MRKYHTALIRVFLLLLVSLLFIPDSAYASQQQEEQPPGLYLQSPEEFLTPEPEELPDDLTDPEEVLLANEGLLNETIYEYESLPDEAQEIELSETQDVISFSVTDFGAIGTDAEDDWYSIQKTLNMANSVAEPITVTIPEGIYYIKKNLRIYSDTTLLLTPDTKIVAAYYGNPMIYGAHLSAPGVVCDYTNCTHYGYTQVQNVTIKGGIWDHNDPNGLGNDSGISFRHSYNIRIEDLTIKNCVSHFINLSGVKKAYVTNVSLEDSVPYTGKEATWWGDYSVGDSKRFRTIEAVHLDYCNANGECTGRALPCDNTPSRNITVSGCTFRNVFSGVGTHHYAIDGRKAENIVVENNFVERMRSSFVYGCDFDNLIVRDNQISGAASLCLLWKCSAKICRNKYKGIGNPFSAMEGVYAGEDSDVFVNNNTIREAGYYGICCDHSSFSIKGNQILSAPTHSFYAANGSTGTFSDNTVKSYANGNSALYIESSKTVIKDNIIRGEISVDAIKLDHSYNCRVYRNLLTGFQGSGLHLIGYSDCIARGNQYKGFQPNAYLTDEGSYCDLKVASPVLKSAVFTNTGVKLAWGKVNGAARYRVYRKTGKGSWKILKEVKAGHFLDKTAKKGKNYRYSVRCLDINGKVISPFNKKGIHP